jgi:hypothetical protein
MKFANTPQVAVFALIGKYEKTEMQLKMQSKCIWGSNIEMDKIKKENAAESNM